MKRSFIHVCIMIIILVFSIASAIRVEPVEALGAMTKLTVGFPAVGAWTAGSLTSIWGTRSGEVVNAYAAGYGMDSGIEKPLFWSRDTNGTWAASILPLPLSNPWYRSGTAQAVWSNGTAVHVVGYGAVDNDGVPGTPETTIKPIIYYSLNGGTNWNVYTQELPMIDGVRLSSGYLLGVWGLSSSDVYAVGYGASGANTIPLIYHFNGSSWTAGVAGLDLWTNVFLKDVWGSGPSDIYAVGSGDVGGNTLPVIYHYNGTTWTPSSPNLPLPPGWTIGSLDAVWGSGSNDIYAVGSGKITGTSDTLPLLFHYQDGSWSASSPDMPSGWTTASLSSVWGVDANEVYLAGDGPGPQPLLYRKAGTDRWAASYSVPGWTSGSFTDVWGVGSNDLYAAGSGTGNLPLLANAVDDTTAPGTVIDLSAVPGALGGEIDLSWTAPADDAGNSYTGPVDSYVVRYSRSDNLTGCSDTNGTLVESGLPVPAAPGMPQTMTVSGLFDDKQHFFILCAVDEENNPGGPAAADAIAQSAPIGFPGAPLLSRPANRASVNDLTPLLDWQDHSPVAAYYRVQVATLNTFTSASLLYDEPSTASEFQIPADLASDITCYWRVYAYNSAGQRTRWSSVRSFTIDTVGPPPPASTSPVDGTALRGVPLFRWRAVSGAVLYEFEIDDEDTFPSPLYSLTQRLTNRRLPGGLRGTYYWRVRARDAAGNWGPWSPVSSIDILPPR
jgi:hypothetical protein